MNFDSLIKARRSVRRFKSTKPDWRAIIEAIDAARFAPMAGNNYTLKFILVSKPEKIQRIAEATQQSFVGTVHYVVVVCSNPKRTINAYAERGELYVKQQTGAAIENFWLKLVEKGLSTCWVGHFVESIIKETLRIPQGIQVEAVFPIGYAALKPIKRGKIDIDSILYFDEYKNKKKRPPKKINV
jgi:nitroreductase